jgi:general secretion pathway protein A
MNIFESFGLNGNPFAENVESDDILLDARFRAALDPLEALPHIGTMGVLTGRTGVGKTTLLRSLIDTWRTTHDVYYLHLGNLRSVGLLRALLNTLGERPRLGKDRMFEQLYTHLSRKQRLMCLVIDEAQLLEVHAMTDLRVLCGHLELANRLILVLSGQGNLDATLNADALTDLRERINIRAHLSSMSLPETFAYIEHRFQRAGAGNPVFDEQSIKLLHRHGEGVPRRINQVGIKAMMNAWNAGDTTVNEMTLRDACAADRS